MQGIIDHPRKVPCASGRRALHRVGNAIKMTTDHSKKADARRLAKEQGIKYTEALRSLSDSARPPFVVPTLDVASHHSRALPDGYGNSLWTCGLTPDGKPIVVTGREHLLVAGSAGSGKSMLLHSMVLQQVHNNQPGCLRYWMVEPKNELQVYRNLDVVERFVDRQSSGDVVLNDAADLLEDAVGEINRRYALTNGMHPSLLTKFAVARDIAREESDRDGTSLEDHALYLPLLVIVLEEAAYLFGVPSIPSEREHQRRLVNAAIRIVGNGQEVGVVLVCTTQVPILPQQEIRSGMSRIGLRVSSPVASMAAIGEEGLENPSIPAGVGRVRPIPGAPYTWFKGYPIPLDQKLVH